VASRDFLIHPTPGWVNAVSVCGRRAIILGQPTGVFMATRKAAPAESGVYRVIDVIGTSPMSWEEAANNAVETASGSLHDLRIAEVARLDVKIEGGKVVAYRARLQLSFKYEREG
jgi:dodecin